MSRIIQRSFTSGELAPALHSRTDLGKYSTGLALCENMIVKAQGGIYARPGTRFIGELDDSTRRARLIPFSFNTEQTYILVFEHLKMRVVKDGGFVVVGAGPTIFELATTYTEAELPRLVVTQSADVMTIVHPDHDPANLNRLAEDNWTLTDIDYSSITTAPGALTLTAVGTGAGTYNKTYTYVVTAVDAAGTESLVSPSNSITTPSLSVTAGVQITWTAVTGADYYRVYKDPSVGTGTYGWIGDTNNATFDDYNIAPITSDAPPEDRQPFTATDDKPATVTYYQQRQVFANTNNEPQTVYATQTANYSSLRTSNPTRADDAVTFTVAGRQVNEVRHLLSLNSLLLLTSGGVWKTTEGQDQVFTPSTVGVRIQSYNGASWVQPVVIGNTALYVQEKGTRVRDLAYQFSNDVFTGNDVSIMSEHLFEGYQIEEMAYAEEPYSILWCIRSDGRMLGLTYKREHEVWGWHQHVTEGTFESVASITEGDRDALYVIVKRTINGSTVRYVERMEPRYVDSAVNAFCVDSGLTYTGAAATAISGLDHLEGEAVAVLADGNEVTGLTVTSGAITLPQAAEVVHVGLAFVPAFETLDIDISPKITDSLKPYDVSVSKVTMEVEDTRGGWVGPKKDDGSTGTMREIKPRFTADGYDTIALRTQKVEIVIEPSWGKGGGIRVEQRSPLPFAVLSIIPEVNIGA